MAITDLTAEMIWSTWDSPHPAKTEKWKAGIAALYFEALNHCVDMGDKQFDDEDKETLKQIVYSYCVNIGESHWGLFQTFVKETLELMESKGVCI